MSVFSAFEETVQPLKFSRGPKSLLAGLRWLFAHPKYLLLGALPAVLASLLLTIGLVILVVFSGSLADLITPFTADFWPWAVATIRLTLQGAIIIGGVILSYVLFTAIALALGDPIYSKIAEKIEAEAGIKLPEASWLAGIQDALSLLAKGSLIALFAFIVSLIPFIGGFLAIAVTWTLLPFVLAEELLSRTLMPRGVLAKEKTKLLLRDKRATWSFGATCQLLFSVPILPIIVMPAAVAGAALLAQELLSDETRETSHDI